MENEQAVGADRLILALNSLIDGERAAAALVALGPAAIDPLRAFLLEGRPGTVYQPRRWAVEALGALDAREVLAEYLTATLPVEDPQVRFAEEAVQNAAIREFLRWPGEGTTQFLLELSRTLMRTGLIEVLGRLRAVEAIPYLDRALEDDYRRPAAEEALIAIGEPARDGLILSAGIRLPVDDVESPSSLRRREAVLRVLGEIGIRPEDWERLAPLIWEEDVEIAARCCVLGVRCGIRQRREAVVQRLIQCAGIAPWFLQEEIVECLVKWFAEARAAIEEEIERRGNRPQAERAVDQCLRLLTRARRLAVSG